MTSPVFAEWGAGPAVGKVMGTSNNVFREPQVQPLGACKMCLFKNVFRKMPEDAESFVSYTQ